MLSKSREFNARKSAILDVKKLNPELTTASIAAMVDRPENSVLAWLCDSESAPDLGDLYVIHNCVLASSLAMPKTLKTLQQRVYNHTRKWLVSEGLNE